MWRAILPWLQDAFAAVCWLCGFAGVALILVGVGT
jgi:hypothetical protein